MTRRIDFAIVSPASATRTAVVCGRHGLP